MWWRWVVDGRLWFIQCRQTPVVLVRGLGNLHSPQASDWLPCQKSFAINPQEFTQRRGITPIRLVFLPFFRLNQNDLVTAILP